MLKLSCFEKRGICAGSVQAAEIQQVAVSYNCLIHHNRCDAVCHKPPKKGPSFLNHQPYACINVQELF